MQVTFKFICNRAYANFQIFIVRQKLKLPDFYIGIKALSVAKIIFNINSQFSFLLLKMQFTLMFICNRACANFSLFQRQTKIKSTPLLDW